MRSISLKVYDVMTLTHQKETVYDVLSLSSYEKIQTDRARIPADQLTQTESNRREVGFASGRSHQQPEV